MAGGAALPNQPATSPMASEPATLMINVPDGSVSSSQADQMLTPYVPRRHAGAYEDDQITPHMPPLLYHFDVALPLVGRAFS
jgi:hypothetical protein